MKIGSKFLKIALKRFKIKWLVLFRFSIFLRQVFKDCLKKIEKRNKTNHLILLNKSIKEAEAAKDEKQLLQLLGEKKRLMEVHK